MMNKTISPVPYLSETIRILQHFDKTLKPLELKEPHNAVEAPKTEVAKKNPYMPDFTWFRPGEDEDNPEEIAIEITYFREPNKHGASDWRDPAADEGWIEFGDANIVRKDGTLVPVVLTPLELEAAERAFWNP